LDVAVLSGDATFAVPARRLAGRSLDLKDLGRVGYVALFKEQPCECLYPRTDRFGMLREELPEGKEYALGVSVRGVKWSWRDHAVILSSRLRGQLRSCPLVLHGGRSIPE
jgi:hypothetical protein